MVIKLKKIKYLYIYYKKYFKLSFFLFTNPKYIYDIYSKIKSEYQECLILIIFRIFLKKKKKKKKKTI